MFDVGAVSLVDSTNAYDKELVICGAPVIKREWKVPMIGELTSNASFDTRHTSPRIVPFRFSKNVRAAIVDVSLQERIITTELGNVVARCLSAYRGLLENGGAGASEIFRAIRPM